MTIKEKLYKEYITIYNKVCELNGNEPLECNEEFFNSPRFQREARTRSKDEWRDSISYQKCAYENEVMRLKRENYYNTEEGKILKEDIEKRLKSVYETRHTYIKETENEIEQTIKSWLGEQWGIRLNNSSMEVGIVKEVRYDENKDKWNDFHFGLVFEIYFGNYFHGEENKRFEMNYGCLGSFNLSEPNNLRSQYLLGMGVFSTDTERLESLKKRLTEYFNILNKLNNESYDLRGKLVNPFKEEKEVA